MAHRAGGGGDQDQPSDLKTAATARTAPTTTRRACVPGQHSQRHHPSHRMPDEHRVLQVEGAHDLLDVVRQPVDGEPVRASHGPAVAAEVHGHGPVAGCGQISQLVVPHSRRQGDPVQQQDGPAGRRTVLDHVHRSSVGDGNLLFPAAGWYLQVGERRQLRHPLITTGHRVLHRHPTGHPPCHSRPGQTGPLQPPPGRHPLNPPGAFAAPVH